MTRQASIPTPSRFYRLLICTLAAATLLTGLLSIAGIASAQGETQVADEAIDYGKISQGRSLFKAWCRTCHGDGAKGDGPMAEYLSPKPADLTLLSQRAGGHFYFGRVKAKIDGREKIRGHGSKDMPVWGEAFLVVDEEGGEEAVREKIEALAHYLRSIQVAAE